MLKYEKIGNQTIAYYEANEHLPNTLVLIHGNMGSWRSWRQVYPLFSQFHIISVNLRGFGQSTTSQSITTLSPFAQDVIKLLELKEIKKITINGWSFGGLVTMKIAELKPEMIDKIILTNAVGHRGYHLKDPKGEWISDEEFMDSDKLKDFEKMLIEKNEEMLRQIFELMLFTHCKQVSEERKKEMVDMAFQQRNTYKDTSEVLVRSKVDISKIEAKWLIVVGVNDKVVPYYIIEPTIEELEKGGKDVRVVKFEEGAHMAPMEVTEKYTKLVKDFILEN